MTARQAMTSPRPAAATTLSRVLLRNTVFTANQSSHGQGRSS